MTTPVTTKNGRLDGVTYTHVSLHTGHPGSTGANEVSGGTYARAAITVNAASGGIRALNAAANVPLDAATVRFLGFWNAGTYLECAPNGGSTPKNYVAVPSTDKIVSTAHGWADTQKIIFSETPPAPLVEGVIYFVRDSATDDFKVAATAGGAAIDLTAAPSAGSWVCAITEDVYVGVGNTHVLSSASFVEP
jgi:hypothetical protein